MIQNSLTDRNNGQLDADSHNDASFSEPSGELAVGAVAGSPRAIAAVSDSQSEPVADIGTEREKLREIRDWHLSKAQMSWSLETQERHQQFADWLDATISASESAL